MKKILMLCVAVMMAATSMKAQHEIGGIVGGMNGLSYKYWFNDALALQADLAVGLTQAAYKGGSAGQYDFTINPNVEYHFDLPANFKIYVGGGLNFGLCDGLGTHGGAYNFDPSDFMDYAPAHRARMSSGSSSTVCGKFGINAICGVTYDIQAVPLVLAFDFRPGYGMSFRDSKVDPSHFFDWKLAFAVRYKL